MHLFTIIVCFLIDLVVFSDGHPYEKCCKSGEHLQKAHESYRCFKNVSKRVDVLTNRTDFLGKNIDGECIDITPEFSIFNVSGGKIIERKPFEGPYFPKCCPLNYIYNTVLHSCEERPNVTHSFIREAFVKVGLPDCKIIMDIKLHKQVDLYGSIIEDDKSSEYCLDENDKGTFTMRECRKNTNVCDRIRCVKKCCPDGQSFVGGRRCVDTYTNGLDLKFSSTVQDPEGPFVVISNLSCKRIFLMDEKRYIFNLTKKGIFQYWTNYSDSYITMDVNERISYCLEHYESERENGYFFFVCRKEKPVQMRFIYPLVPKILSCVFLILTILIYFFLNEIRSLFGKILINYCLATLFLFSLLCYTHRTLEPDDNLCKILAYLLIYSSTATFHWLNVISFDIWWTFGSSKQVRSDLKRLVYYLLYGWGLPTLLTLLIFLLSRSNILPWSVHPFVGNFQCFIEKRPGNYAKIIFVRLPHLVIQLVNLVLFVKTIVYYLRGKNELHKCDETTKLQKKANLKRERERLSLIMKLAIIMGLTYIFDVGSAFFNMSELGTIPEYIEIIWDCINCSQGIFVFIIFICKKRIYDEFLKKIKTGTRATSSNSSSNTTTSTPMIALNRKPIKTM